MKAQTAELKSRRAIKPKPLLSVPTNYSSIRPLLPVIHRNVWYKIHDGSTNRPFRAGSFSETFVKLWVVRVAVLQSSDTLVGTTVSTEYHLRADHLRSHEDRDHESRSKRSHGTRVQPYKFQIIDRKQRETRLLLNKPYITLSLYENCMSERNN